MKLLGNLIACIGLITTLLSAQSPVNILSVQQGLPRSQINMITQDSFDFLWLGTRDGLLKCDGSDIMIFSKKNNNFPFDNCNRLFFDREHRLWVTSNSDYRGAAVFNVHKLTYTVFDKAHFPTLSGNGLVDVTQDIEGEIAIIAKDFQVECIRCRG